MTRVYSSSGSPKSRVFVFECVVKDLSGIPSLFLKWRVYHGVPQLIVDNLNITPGQFRYELNLFINRAIMVSSGVDTKHMVDLFCDNQLD